MQLISGIAGVVAVTALATSALIPPAQAAPGEAVLSHAPTADVAERERMAAYRPLWAAFWLGMPVPGTGSWHRTRWGRLRPGPPISWRSSPTSRLGGRPETGRGQTHDDKADPARMATTNDLKNGMVLNIEGRLWTVIEFQHVKPGKGPAFVRTKLKNVESNKTVDKTFNAGTKVETANVDKRTMQYLYNDGTSYVFMDTTTFDQLEIAPEIVGDAKNFLLENQDAIVATNEGRVLFVELPASVELLIAETEPGLQGDRSTGGTKPATLETGHQIQVPLFITSGEKVKVDTRDSSYLGRVKG